jgi:hypothetical protein
VTREFFNSVLNRLSAEFSNVDEQKLQLVITTKSESFREVLCYTETKYILMSEVGLKELNLRRENFLLFENLETEIENFVSNCLNTVKVLKERTVFLFYCFT